MSSTGVVAARTSIQRGYSGVIRQRRFASSSSHGEHHSSGSDMPWIIGAIVVTVPVVGYLLTAGSPNVHAGGHEHGDVGHHVKPTSPKKDDPAEEEKEPVEEQPEGAKEDGEKEEQSEDKGEESGDKGGESGDKSVDQSKVEGGVKVDKEGTPKPVTKKKDPIKQAPDGSAVSLRRCLLADHVGFKEGSSPAG